MGWGLPVGCVLAFAIGFFGSALAEAGKSVAVRLTPSRVRRLIAQRRDLRANMALLPCRVHVRTSDDMIEPLVPSIGYTSLLALPWTLRRHARRRLAAYYRTNPHVSNRYPWDAS